MRRTILIPALVPAGLLLHEHLEAAQPEERVGAIVADAALAAVLVLIVSRGVGLLRVAEQRSGDLRDHSAALETALADRERVAYRFRVRNPEGLFLVEQQVYIEEREGRIGWMRSVCSGFRPIEA